VDLGHEGASDRSQDGALVQVVHSSTSTWEVVHPSCLVVVRWTHDERKDGSWKGDMMVRDSCEVVGRDDDATF
jgi:hypothetical protein